MASSLFLQSNQYQMNSNSMMDVIQQFAQFKKQMQGKDPKEEVMKLLQSGKINNEQLNQAMSVAKQLEEILK